MRLAPTSCTRREYQRLLTAAEWQAVRLTLLVATVAVATSLPLAKAIAPGTFCASMGCRSSLSRHVTSPRRQTRAGRNGRWSTSVFRAGVRHRSGKISSITYTSWRDPAKRPKGVQCAVRQKHPMPVLSEDPIQDATRVDDRDTRDAPAFDDLVDQLSR